MAMLNNQRVYFQGSQLHSPWPTAKLRAISGLQDWEQRETNGTKADTKEQARAPMIVLPGLKSLMAVGFMMFYGATLAG